MANVLFRADSSSQIGTGHIMRDLVLAKQCESDTVIFACQDLEGNLIDKIPYRVEILKTNDFDELNRLIKKLDIDMIVIDHYGIDYAFEKALKIQNPKLKIFVLDDTYEKHYCDILLNHNICADENRYKGLVPKHCELRCGSKYTLLREEFYREKNIKRKKVYDVFIAMGGADHSNINIKILETLKDLQNINVVIVTTSANKNLKKLQRYCRSKVWIELFVDSAQVAKLLGESRYAIVSPSVVVNEVYTMQVPFIAIKTADNQNDMYTFLKQQKFHVLNRFNRYRLKRKLWKLL